VANTGAAIDQHSANSRVQNTLCRLQQTNVEFSMPPRIHSTFSLKAFEFFTSNDATNMLSGTQGHRFYLPHSLSATIRDLHITEDDIDKIHNGVSTAAEQ
jgi:hypothetical protein